jgi:hypothetical protein
MNAPSIDLKDLLDGESSLGLMFAIDLFVSEMPVEPDFCVALYDTGGADPEAAYAYARPTVQVRVRGNRRNYTGAYDSLKAIVDFLHGTYNETVNSTRYVSIWLVGDILALGYDDNSRPLLTANFRMHRTTI